MYLPESRFTDDTVLAVATADAIMSEAPFGFKYKEYFRRYPHAGYGKGFTKWAQSRDSGPYGSWGNGSAMRVAPVGWAFSTLEQTLEKAHESAVCSHDHPEGIKGAKAVAGAIFLARMGRGKAEIREWISKNIGYELDIDLVKLRETYKFDSSCQGSVPQALAAFFAGNSFEEAIRLAVSIGGDSDTIACMAGSVAEAHFGGVPENFALPAWKILPKDLREIIVNFYKKYKIPTAFELHC